MEEGRNIDTFLQSKVEKRKDVLFHEHTKPLITRKKI